MTFLQIYLMAGFAHWCAHILQCISCRTTIWDNTTFLLEGCVSLFGWPIQLLEYGMLYLKKKEKLPHNTTREQTEALFKKAGLDQMKPEPGETFEAYYQRVNVAIQDYEKKNGDLFL